MIVESPSVAGPLAAAIAERVAGVGAEDRPPYPLEAVADGLLDLGGEYSNTVLAENVIAAVEASLDQGETHYTARPGLPALALAVARKLEREQGLVLDPATEVIISTGGRESLFVGEAAHGCAVAHSPVPACSRRSSW